MGDSYIKKNGLLYSSDLHTVLGVDDTSNFFTGRVPYGAHVIDGEVFSACPYESISLPDSVKQIGNAVFENSLALEKVKLPSSIKNLPPYLFAGCSALVKITMPNTLESFSEGLFKGCSSLTEIPFRSGLKELPPSVFEGCSSIKSLVIPSTVEKICSRSVAACTSLETVVIPSNVQEIALDAFSGCNAIRSVRIDGDSSLFFVGEDGNLYKKGASSDELLIRVCLSKGADFSFFKENPDDIAVDIAEDEEEDEDDTFSAEIGPNDEETGFMELSRGGLMENALTDGMSKNNNENSINKEKNMEGNNVDSMLADIMGEEKERVSSEVGSGVSEKEAEVLSEAMSVMSESSVQSGTGNVSTEELENLFSKQEKEALDTSAIEEEKKNPNLIDGKTKILIDSVAFSRVLHYEPKGSVPEDGDLFVIAEKTVTDEKGNKDFSKKLVSCCNTFARIHDFRRVFLLAGLPFENDEFTQFYFHYINKRNVILACEAESPSGLSDYAKKICEESRISLEKNELMDQRKSASVKTQMLIKLVIRDKYEK